ncbi:MAG TPA: ASPIC/UnbV domain-containing protein, partial [Blastocatellia bacterium]|nr:ASPIC/UnbV domain-containing protein [Blastocatellia bacterium]
NDGDIDILINPVNAIPELLRCDSSNQNNWITIKAVGVKSNRSGIGARIKCVTEDGNQIAEVRSGGSYFSQNDLRVHFGLGKRDKVKSIEIRWPDGQAEMLNDVSANQTITVKEGSGILRALPAGKAKTK